MSANTPDAAQRICVFLATSLDGHIAGPGDDLGWLPGPDALGDDGGFGAFLAGVGALLMGRRTLDVVAGFGGPWPYGDRPVLVATHRPLPEVPGAALRAVSGEIGALVALAREAAGAGHVYLDGGILVRQALDAGLVDELTLTTIPVLLAGGVPLFAGLTRRTSLVRTALRPLGADVVQTTYRIVR